MTLEPVFVGAIADRVFLLPGIGKDNAMMRPIVRQADGLLGRCAAILSFGVLLRSAWRPKAASIASVKRVVANREVDGFTFCMIRILRSFLVRRGATFAPFARRRQTRKWTVRGKVRP